MQFCSVSLQLDVPEVGVPDLNLIYASFCEEGEVCCKLNILMRQPVLQKK